MPPEAIRDMSSSLREHGKVKTKVLETAHSPGTSELHLCNCFAIHFPHYFNFFILLFYVYVIIAYIYVYSPRVCSVLGGQKRQLHALRLEFKAVCELCGGC